LNMLKNRKAISPVIATVILVAVAITIAVAVSYWMGGITSSYTKFEKVEIQSAVCTLDLTNHDWVITMSLKNTGTATTTLLAVYINDIPVDLYDGTTPGAGKATADITTTGLTIASGAKGTVVIKIDGIGDTGEASPPVAGTDYWYSVSSGTTINVKVHSAGGMDYIKLVDLV